ncbi:type I-E CRISPR-associated protein Cas5/CasD [Kutzneria sp. NPDC052558]|uniref:type I-E CRISPR-associated protein Cas5/CasD n=1 Tax=Kutzneria sp. NPDC052558 TaxID=3364121 RepID=UPI0037C73BF0
MNAILKLCFDAPMQSWGTRSHGIIRDTATEPTKSGVLGLLGAAMGIDRTDDASLAELARLSMGVRVDRQGILERDYQTAQNVPTTTGSGHRTVVSERYYLADALFLVILEGDAGLLARVADAVRRPRWRLYLGRRAFVPTRPILIEPGLLTGQTLHDALTTHPWLVEPDSVRCAERAKSADDRAPLRLIVDCPPTLPEAEIRNDHPISFAPDRRRFATRSVLLNHTPLTNAMLNVEVPSCS